MRVENGQPQEQFMNAGGLCIVLKRIGTKVLIHRPCNTLTPYVVPISHIEGESSWYEGRYFSRIEDAEKLFNEEVAENI